MLSQTNVINVIKNINADESSVKTLEKLAGTSSALRRALEICGGPNTELNEKLSLVFVNCYLAGILAKLEVKEPSNEVHSNNTAAEAGDKH